VLVPEAITSYFRNIIDAVTTILDGMAVTGSHLVRQPSTIQYPDRIEIPVKDTLPFRYRGILAVDVEICTACMACERACPIDCIAIDAVKDKEAGGLVLQRFEIDIIKCMHCGLCSEPCPTGAIHHTTEFEAATFDIGELVYSFVKEPRVAYKVKKTGEDDPAILPILERGRRHLDEFATPPAPPPKPAAKPTATPAAEKGGAGLAESKEKKEPEAERTAGGTKQEPSARTAKTSSSDDGTES
jgi:formate hydrogenlyase subunit 6/NADH:ubiquinone oxidoreductase subunit I